MNIKVKRDHLLHHRTAGLVIPLFENEKPGEEVLRFDRAYHCPLTSLMARGDFKGSLHQTAVLYLKDAPAERLILVGLGKRSDVNRETLRGAFAVAAKRFRDLKIRSFSAATAAVSLDWPVPLVVEAMVEGTLLGLYAFTRYKTDPLDRSDGRGTFRIIVDPSHDMKASSAAAKTAALICQSVCDVRDMVSRPANEMTPALLAGTAGQLGKEEKIKVRILKRSDLQKLGMRAHLAVARGSREAPVFIILEYRGGGKPVRPHVLVGKGITFDSGGLSLKSAEGMGEMKDDMAGGAAVMGTLRAVAGLGLPLNLVGLIPAAENLPDGNAYRPGDVIRSFSGKTIEVVSTDAEGRLLLADALAYARRFKPTAVIDIATLTGACSVALGDKAIGMLGTDVSLKERIRAAGEATGERVWELPLWEEYQEQIRSDVADLKNTGGREGGVITAAAFLSHFVGPHPWVHLDIAATAWLKKDRPYIPKGATGVGVRLLTEFFRCEAAGKNGRPVASLPGERNGRWVMSSKSKT